jgi:hypothetical protein
MSNEARFTPGPWKSDRAGSPNAFIVTAKDGQHDVAVVRDIGNENNAANAALIAAAPDLYAALMAYRGVKQCGHAFTCICADDLAKAALAKARGEA